MPTAPQRLGEGKSAEAKQEAMDLAESARETQWVNPSFVAELFKGTFRADLVLPFPEQPKKDKEEGDAFLAKFGPFIAQKIDANEIDRSGDIPKATLDGLMDLGAFGMKIDKEYGGLGFSQTNYVRALTYIGGHCGNVSTWLSAHQSIGVPQPLKIFGTPEQKKKFLPRLIKEISAFALTEPGAGSDPAEMTMRADPSPDGKHWILNGTKLWCTNGAVANILIVMARTPDLQKNGKSKKQITAFIVEKTMPGFRVVHRCRFMGLHGIQNAVLEFKDVKVPTENIIGQPGQGLKIALTTLNTGRISLPAICTGLTKKCCEMLRHWTAERVQWGAPIGKHEEVAAKNALAASGAFTIEAITHWCAAMVDRGGMDVRLEAAMAKLFCTEVCWKIVYETVQARGGRGFENAYSLKARGEVPIPIERAFRDIRVNTILEGSTEIMHLLIAREALDFHMRILMKLLVPGIGNKILTLLQMAFTYAFWYPRQWIFWGRWPLFAMRHRKLARHLRFISRRSRKLARSVFHMLMIHQLGLERRQLVLGRLVEIGTELFAMSMSCSRAQLSVDKKIEDGSVELADHFCWGARTRVKQHFRGLYCNEDKKASKISKDLISGRFTWLEKGTVQNNIVWESR